MAIVVAVALLAVAALAGLALDGSHMVANKARFQSVVDAAALAAAKKLDETGSTVQATTAANSVFNTNKASFSELDAASGVGIAIEYSASLVPFSAGTAPPKYVRITVTNFTFDTTFMRVAGRDTLTQRASAISGPRVVGGPGGSVCDLAPMLVCGTAAAGAPTWGYPQGQVTVLKIGAQGSSAIGPGNFQLIRLGGNGANIVRQNLAGGYQSCNTVSTSVETQTGNVAGPVSQGMNTRFGQYQGGGMNATDYPPDVITRTPTPTLSYDTTTGQVRQGSTTVTTASQINYNYDTYRSQVGAQNYNNQPAPSGNGGFNRRRISVPIADCSGSNSGNSTLPILGFGCFFVLQPVEQSGNQSFVYAEVVKECGSSGGASSTPGVTTGPHKIVLHRDVRSPDS